MEKSSLTELQVAVDTTFFFQPFYFKSLQLVEVLNRWKPLSMAKGACLLSEDACKENFQLLQWMHVKQLTRFGRLTMRRTGNYGWYACAVDFVLCVVTDRRLLLHALTLWCLLLSENVFKPTRAWITFQSRVKWSQLVGNNSNFHIQ